jgi:hypothetical protein
MRRPEKQLLTLEYLPSSANVNARADIKSWDGEEIGVAQCSRELRADTDSHPAIQFAIGQVNRCKAFSTSGEKWGYNGSIINCQLMTKSASIF